MNNNRVVSVLLVLLILSVQLAGCAPTMPEKVDLFWPPHPDDPKIAYVQELHYVSDIVGFSFFDRLLGASKSTLFERPYGVAALGDRVLVTDPASAEVARIDLKGKTIEFMNAMRPKIPVGVAINDEGSFFVTDTSQGKVFSYDANGKFVSAFGKTGEMKRPSGLAVDNKLGRIYVADAQSSVVQVYSMAGERLFTIGKPGPREGELHGPTNLAIDRKTGNVVVSDSSNFRVQVFDKDGKFLFAFGENGDVPGTFARPKGIGVDSEGNIYVVDAAFNNVQVFSREGVLLTFLGGAGSSAGEFSLPAGLYVDPSDRIYVVDQMNSRVQVFQYMSEQWKKGHPAEYERNLLASHPAQKNAGEKK